LSENSKINNAAKISQLDFLYDLHTQEVEIGDESRNLLRKHGYIKDVDIIKKVVAEKIDKDKIHNNPFYTDSEVSEIDKSIDIVHEGENILNKTSISEEDYRKWIEEKGSVIFSGMKIHITPEDWMPESITEHRDDFVEWIDSISFAGFANRGNYRKFNLYCQQAYQWLAENDSLANYSDHDDRENYKDQEIERCSQNTLYFLNKYLQLKESTLVAGLRQYAASKAHEIIVYLFDCGYSFYLGKPRQIAATSTLGGCALKRTIFKRNHFIKFITENDSKGQEIFEDKIKYPFAELPDWMRDDARNDSGTKFVLGYKDKKGDRGGTNSNIFVSPPTPTAISGGSPQLALIDEAGNIPILTQIIEDARPTSFWMNPLTGRMERKRQIIVWGTGGDMEKGGKAFEREFMSALKNWRERKFSSGIIPLFFDWTTRMGISQEIYESEKEFYYSKEGPEAEASRIMFRQQYPSCVEDMFLTSAKTLVSQEYIAEQIDRIRRTKVVMKPQFGYFEPVYGDVEQPEGSDIPFNIIGANFVPLEVGDKRISVTIFQHPKRWRNRYYKGTDPIASDTGMSKMSGVIWDKYYNTMSAVVNYRTNDYREVYLQTLLLGIYYDWENNIGVKELLETNIGIAYREYATTKGRFDTLVFNSELPEAYQSGSGNLVGIDNRGVRNKMIINDLFELIQGFGSKIYIEDFFIQLKTFVSSTTARGNETWGPADRKHYNDDILFAAVFSYICAQCFPDEKPYCVDEDKKGGIKIVSRLARDKNYNMYRVYEKVKTQ
jgi:hypothetical protein